MSHNLNPNAREFVPKGVNPYSAPTGLPAASPMYGVNAYPYPYPSPNLNDSYYKDLYVKSLYERNEELERLKKERVDLLKEQESITRKYSDMVCSTVALRKEHNALKAEFETLQQRYDAAEGECGVSGPAGTASGRASPRPRGQRRTSTEPL